MIKLICFDLDGVYFTEKGKAGFLEELSKISGKGDKVKEFLTTSVEMRNLSLGEIGEGAFVDALNKILSIDLSLLQLSELRSKHYEIDEKVNRIVLRLKSNGYKVGICTNNNPIRIRSLQEKFHFLELFDVFVTSYEYGYFKPSKELFMKLIESGGCKAREIIYSDDNHDRLSGAKDLGMKTYLYDDFEGYIEFLRNEGINIS